MVKYTLKTDIPLGLTFDDVLLRPAESYIEPNEADVRSRFSKKIDMNIPLVSSAMDIVTESAMAIALAREGGIGVLHRNMSAEAEVAEVGVVKRADDIIEREVLTVGPSATLADVDRLMSDHGISGVPVMDEGTIIGIVSRRDLRGIVHKRGAENICNVMTSDPITASEDILPRRSP